MNDNLEIERIEPERVELLREATRIVQATEMAGRDVSDEEDARVLALMARVRSLEEKLSRLKRRLHQDVQTHNRSDDKLGTADF